MKSVLSFRHTPTNRLQAILVTTAFVLLIGFYSRHDLAAQPKPATPETLRVATRVVPPFVIRQGTNYSGFSIDLWQALSREMGVQTQFLPADTVKDLLGAVRTNKAVAGISAISITSERESILDFSQPMFDAGLQILVRDHDGGGAPNLLTILFSSAMLQTLGIVALMILIPAHLIWLFERSHDNGIIENKSYFPGIFKAFWWAAGTLGAQADEMPRSNWGRVVALFWMFTGIAFVAYFTAIVTASMTVQHLQGRLPPPLPSMVARYKKIKFKPSSSTRRSCCTTQRMKVKIKSMSSAPFFAARTTASRSPQVAHGEGA